MINNLTEKIMCSIGLDIDANHILKDQDYGEFVLMNDKYLKCSYDNREPAIGSNDIYFNPLYNIKIMEFVFAYFLQKYGIMNNIYFSSFATIKNADKSALDVRGDINIISQLYKSETLKYIDIILRISGYHDVEFLKEYDGKIR